MKQLNSEAQGTQTKEMLHTLCLFPLSLMRYQEQFSIIQKKQIKELQVLLNYVKQVISIDYLQVDFFFKHNLL